MMMMMMMMVMMMMTMMKYYDDDDDDVDDDGNDDDDGDDDDDDYDCDDDDDHDDDEDDDDDDDDDYYDYDCDCDDHDVNSVVFARLGEGGVRTDVNGCLKLIGVLTMMLLRKQLKCEHSLMPAATRVWAAHLTEELTYLLHATVRLRRNPHVDVSKEAVLTQKTNKKEGHNFDSRKGKNEGRRKDHRKKETPA